MGDFTPHFNISNFACKCGCGFNAIDMDLVLDLEKWRMAYGKPMTVVSGCRCEKHNEAEYLRLYPGKSVIKTSSHLTGHAIDIRCMDSHERWWMLTVLGHLITTGEVGIKQLELCKTWMHIANDPAKGQEIAYYG